jgi:hypothetical protein
MLTVLTQIAGFFKVESAPRLLYAGCCSIAVVLVGPLYRSEWLLQIGAV